MLRGYDADTRSALIIDSFLNTVFASSLEKNKNVNGIYCNYDIFVNSLKETEIEYFEPLNPEDVDSLFQSTYVKDNFAIIFSRETDFKNSVFIMNKINIDNLKKDDKYQKISNEFLKNAYYNCNATADQFLITTKKVCSFGKEHIIKKDVMSGVLATDGEIYESKRDSRFVRRVNDNIEFVSCEIEISIKKASYIIYLNNREFQLYGISVMDLFYYLPAINCMIAHNNTGSIFNIPLEELCQLKNKTENSDFGRK